MPGHLGVIYSNNTIWERVKVLNIRAGNRKNIEVCIRKEKDTYMNLYMHEL